MYLDVNDSGRLKVKKKVSGLLQEEVKGLLL